MSCRNWWLNSPWMLVEGKPIFKLDPAVRLRLGLASEFFRAPFRYPFCHSRQMPLSLVHLGVASRRLPFWMLPQPDLTRLALAVAVAPAGAFTLALASAANDDYN